MLSVLGKPRRCCDGVARRELLRVGALSFFGSLLAVFADAIVLLAVRPTPEARGEVLTYKRAIVAVIPAERPEAGRKRRARGRVMRPQFLP